MEDFSEAELEQQVEAIIAIILGKDQNYVPITDLDQINESVDRDILTRIFHHLETDSYWRIIWADIYAPGSVDNPTLEVMEFFQVAPQEKTYTEWVEVFEDDGIEEAEVV